MTSLVPSKPTSLFCTTKPDEISVTWAFVGVFDRFEISYGYYSQWPEVIDRQYSNYRNHRIKELQPETKYFIEIRTEHEGLQSEPAETTATTQPGTVKPVAPTEFRAVPEAYGVDLFWQKTERAAGYRVSYGLVPSGPVIDTLTVTVETCWVSGLSSDTAYYFDLAAFNAAGESPKVRTTATTHKVPPAPTNLRAVPAIISMEVTWSSSPGATEYVIRYGLEPGGNPKEQRTNQLRGTLENLQKNTLYYVKVSASNGMYESLPTSITARTLDGPPLPPKPGIPVAVATHHSVQVAWSIPGSPSYRVSLLNEQYEEIRSEFTSYMNHRFKDLPPETRFHVEVRGVNASGESDPATVSFTTKAFGAPVNLRCIQLDYESVGYKWMRNLHDPSGLMYEVYLDETLKETTSEQQVHLTGLISDKRYEIKVRAKTIDGHHSAFAIDSFTTTLFKGWLICSPGNLKGQRISPTTLKLDWSMDYDTCEICPKPVGFEISGEGITTFEVLRPPCEVKGLSADRVYNLSVRAKAGGSNISEPSNVRISAFPPKAGALQITNVTSRSAKAMWAAATGNVPVSEYVLYSNGTYIGSVKGLEYQIKELEPNTEYRIEVRARAGGSGLSEPVQQVFTTLEDSSTVPNPPTNFRFRWVNLLVAVLEWDAPVGGPPPTLYKIILTSGQTSLSYDSTDTEIRPVLPVARYQVTITARNGAGDSLPLEAEMGP